MMDILLLLVFLPEGKPGGNRPGEFPGSHTEETNRGQTCEHGNCKDHGCHTAERDCPFIELFHVIECSQHVIDAYIEGCHGRCDHKYKGVIPCGSCSAVQHCEAEKR